MTASALKHSGISIRRHCLCLTVGLVLACLSLIGQAFFTRTSDYILVKDNSFKVTTMSSSRHFQMNETVNVSLDKASHSKTEAVAGTSLNDGTKPEFPRICLESPLPKATWDWHNFSRSERTNNTKTRLLIAQYSAHGTYARLLELTSPINKEYAKRWHHDIVILQGTTMILPYDKDCTPPEERSRFNKVALLLNALSFSYKYDQVLILDADTIIYDFSVDITTLLPADYMLTAQRVYEDDPIVTTSINNGVTLWNLRNPLTNSLAREWDRASREGIPDNRPFRGDQYYLKKVLRREEYRSAVWTVWNEFYYKNGTVIKHFQRSNSRSWNDTGLETREERIKIAVREICHRFDLDADSLEYTLIPQ